MIHPGYGFLSENAEFAKACARGGHHVCRAAPELLDQHGRQGRRARAGAKSRRAHAAGTEESGDPIRDEALEGGEGNRFSAHHQGGVRRRRTRHARGAKPATSDLLDEAQGEAGARLAIRRCFWKNTSRAPSTSRCRFSATSTATWCTARARLLGAAPPPEGHRDRAELRPAENASSAGIVRGRGALCARDQIRQRRHGRIPLRPRHAGMVLHRDEPAHPGGAHGHRVITGHRPGALADSHRRGQRAARPGGRHLPAQEEIRATATPCSAASRPRTRKTNSRPTTARSSPIAAPAGSASGWTAAWAIRRRGHHAVLRFAAGEAHRLSGRRPSTRVQRMDRALREFRIRGVKTNIRSSENVIHTRVPQRPGDDDAD
jgi:hypothetical protein